MLRAWQKRLLNNREIRQYEFSTVGSHTLDIKAGFYNVALVGAGGGGACSQWSYFLHSAKGGVGGVILAQIKVPNDTTITINIGKGGTSKGKGTTATGTSGTDTTITGVENLVLIAGGGTGAQQNKDSSIAGTQGENIATGTNIVRVIENNKNLIISGTNAGANPTPVGEPNTNWAEDTSKGYGGDAGGKVTGFTSATYKVLNGGNGFVRITTAY